MRGGADVVGDLGLGLIGGLATIGERLFDSFLDGRPEKITKPPEPPANDDVRVRREAARQQRIEAAIETELQEQQRRRSEDYWRERRQRNRD
ncbi:MAG: hypothetical protein WDN31_02630 [Hyphomicrobium sp.]